MKHIVNLTILMFFSTLLKLDLYPQIQLPSPNLIYPEHKQGFEFAPTGFRWHEIKDAMYYEIQITTDVTFVSPFMVVKKK